MHFDTGDQLSVVILAIGMFILAHEHGKIRRQLRDLRDRLDRLERRQK
jgi:hypothetical protein